MNKLKVGTRLSLGFGCVCLLLLITIGVGINRVGVLHDGTTCIVQNKATDLWPVLRAHKEEQTALIAHENAAIATTGKVAEQTYIDSRNPMIGLGVIALLVATAIGVVITGRLLKQLAGEPDYAATLAGEIAAGNLGVKVVAAPNDLSSLMFAMDSMRGQLAGVVREVRAGSDLITTASGEIAAGNQDLSVRTEQKAGALEETASSIDELTSTVRQDADDIIDVIDGIALQDQALSLARAVGVFTLDNEAAAPARVRPFGVTVPARRLLASNGGFDKQWEAC